MTAMLHVGRKGFHNALWINPLSLKSNRKFKEVATFFALIEGAHLRCTTKGCASRLSKIRLFGLIFDVAVVMNEARILDSVAGAGVETIQLGILQRQIVRADRANPILLGPF